MAIETAFRDWERLLDSIGQRHVLVLGDVILDAYVRGDVTRISAEAPVPIVEVTHEEYRLGGAANVAANLASLGTFVHLFGVVGEDQAATEFLKLLNRRNIPADGIATDPSRPTSFKTRIVARTQQIVRLDRESRASVDAELRREILRGVHEHLEGCDAVILEDYDKGILDEATIAEVRDAARGRGIPVLVDPKVENFRHYRRVTCVTPNTNEAGGGAGTRIHTRDDLRDAGRRLLEGLELDFLLITRGADGMSLFERREDEGHIHITHIPAVAREVYDVTGAGDTVIAIFTAALAAGALPVTAARLANHAAGIVCGHLGCATVSPGELLTDIREQGDINVNRITVETLERSGVSNRVV